jgi:hypothetical protein
LAYRHSVRTNKDFSGLVLVMEIHPSDISSVEEPILDLGPMISFFYVLNFRNFKAKQIYIYQDYAAIRNFYSWSN